jgi:Family of unknown function (DUF6504)
MARFVSEALTASADYAETGGLSRGEPPLPKSFAWHDQQLVVHEVVRTWRSTNTDRGDTYLARHWFEISLDDGRVAVLYFDRKSRRGEARWWLYTITGADA